MYCKQRQQLLLYHFCCDIFCWCGVCCDIFFCAAFIMSAAVDLLHQGGDDLQQLVIGQGVQEGGQPQRARQPAQLARLAFLPACQIRPQDPRDLALSRVFASFCVALSPTRGLSTLCARQPWASRRTSCLTS